MLHASYQNLAILQSQLVQLVVNWVIFQLKILTIKSPSVSSLSKVKHVTVSLFFTVIIKLKFLKKVLRFKKKKDKISWLTSKNFLILQKLQLFQVVYQLDSQLIIMLVQWNLLIKQENQLSWTVQEQLFRLFLNHHTNQRLSNQIMKNCLNYWEEKFLKIWMN